MPDFAIVFPNAWPAPFVAESILRERLLLSHPGGIARASDTTRAAAAPQSIKQAAAAEEGVSAGEAA